MFERSGEHFMLLLGWASLALVWEIDSEQMPKHSIVELTAHGEQKSIIRHAYRKHGDNGLEKLRRNISVGLPPHALSEVVDRTKVSTLHALGQSPPASAFNIGDVNTNNCPPGFDEIATESECAQAASALGKTYQNAHSFSSSPKGCLESSNNAVYFNTHSTGAAHDVDKPICQVTPEYVTGATGTNACPPEFNRIATVEGCQLAASFLGTSHQYDGSWPGNDPDRPRGCFEDTGGSGSLYFNSHPTGSAKDTDTPVCQASNYYVGPADTNDCPSGFGKITTASDCQQAATAVGKPFESEDSWEMSPAGCITCANAEKTCFNTHETGQAHDNDVPICQVTYATGEANTNSCPPAYEEIPNWIRCQQAAVELGFTYQASGNFDASPNGCFLGTSNEDVHFNPESPGVAHVSQSPICQASHHQALYHCTWTTYQGVCSDINTNALTGTAMVDTTVDDCKAQCCEDETCTWVQHDGDDGCFKMPATTAMGWASGTEATGSEQCFKRDSREPYIGDAPTTTTPELVNITVPETDNGVLHGHGTVPGTDAISCRWADWDEWGICESDDCYTGNRTRHREVAQEPDNGGDACKPNDGLEFGMCECFEEASGGGSGFGMVTKLLAMIVLCAAIGGGGYVGYQFIEKKRKEAALSEEAKDPFGYGDVTTEDYGVGEYGEDEW